MQVLGGYGYTEDFILEQLARDVRIMTLYEGTTGIQSQALLGRQIPMNQGRALKYWKKKLRISISRSPSYRLSPYAGHPDQCSKQAGGHYATYLKQS